MDGEMESAIRESLVSLGWLPSDLNCAEKRRLAEDYLDATKAWFEAGRGLWRALTERLRQSYRPLPQHQTSTTAVEEARLNAARARLALEAHIASHNC